MMSATAETQGIREKHDYRHNSNQKFYQTANTGEISIKREAEIRSEREGVGNGANKRFGFNLKEQGLRGGVGGFSNGKVRRESRHKKILISSILKVAW